MITQEVNNGFSTNFELDWQGINRSGYQEFPLQTPITTAAIYRQSLAEAELSMVQTKREADW